MRIGSMKPVYRWFLHFFARLALLALLFFVIYRILVVTELLYPVQLFETGIAAFVMRLFYPGIQSDGILLGNLVVSGEYTSFGISIDPLCSGYFGVAAIAALFLALPGIGWKKRKKCLLVGVPAIFAINLLRIIGVIFIAALFGFASFIFAHAILFKADLIFFIILLFFLCLQFVIGKQAILDAAESF